MPRLTEAELADRRKGLGSTCIVEANGLAPWRGAGPMRLFNEKLGIISADDSAEEELEDDEDYLNWGHVMEEVYAAEFEKRYGVKLQLGGPRYSTEMPNFWASLDRTIVGANEGVEIKNVGSPHFYRHWDTSSPDGVPNYVRAQCTMHMRFTGFGSWKVFAGIGGRPPHCWTVFYDSELSDLLFDGAKRFWQLVQDGTPPPIDATTESRAYLLHKYPANVDRRMIDATELAEEWAAKRIEAASEYARAKTIIDTASNELLALVGDADGVQGNGWKCTWKLDKNQKRRPRFTGKGDDSE